MAKTDKEKRKESARNLYLKGLEQKEIAEMIYERHELLTDFLVKLGVNPEVAAEDACRIEHVISAESFAAVKVHASQLS